MTRLPRRPALPRRSVRLFLAARTTGGALTQLLTYSNQATVDTAGVDFSMNWFGNLGDMGLQSVPGGIGLNIQGTYLDKYITKLSPTASTFRSTGRARWVRTCRASTAVRMTTVCSPR